MREALRRVLATIPLAFAASVLAFALVSAAVPEREPPSRPLPRFINREPEDARALSLGLMRRIAEGSLEVGQASLAEQGGAALPHVLPALDALPPGARASVAESLLPVAVRMGVLAPGAQASPSAVAFWQNYWQDRGVDFRPVVAQRLVERLVDSDSSLSRRALVELDTFALPALMAVFHPARTANEVQALSRIAKVMAHVTGKDWVIAPGDAPASANAVVLRWKRWWVEHQARYVTWSGLLRATSVLTETEYARWVANTARFGLGWDAKGRRLGAVLWQRSLTSVWLLLPPLIAAYWLAPVFAAWLSRRPRGRKLALGSAMLGATLPVVGVLGPIGQSANLAAAIICAIAWTSARVLLHELYRPPNRPEAQGMRSPASVLLATELCVLGSLVILLEQRFGLEGLGSFAVDSLAIGDRHSLVWLAVFGVIGSAVLRNVADASPPRKKAARLLLVRESSSDLAHEAATIAAVTENSR